MSNKIKIQKNRNSNIELLRIISMIMIVFSHYSVHSKINIESMPISFNRFFLEIISVGNIGVIIFVLITGYYNIEKNKVFRIDKIIILVLQVVFYSVVLYFLLVIFKQIDFNFINMVKAILPISFKQYWFITAYISLYIIMPFLNIFLKSISKKQYSIFLIVIIGYFIALRTITTCDYYGNELLYFILFYSIGGFIKIHKDNLFNRHSTRLIITSGLVLVLSVITFDLLGLKYPIFNKKTLYFYDKSNIIPLMTAVGIFCKFINLKEFNNSIINTVSKGIFGVYLIHNNTYVIPILWGRIFNASKYVNSPELIIHCIVSVCVVFSACIIIDLIRYWLIETNIKKIVERMSKRITDYFSYKVSNKIIM